MSLRMVFACAALAFCIWWIIQQPASAAHLVQNIGHLVQAGSAAVARTLRFP